MKVDKRSRDLLARLDVLGEVTKLQALELVDEVYTDGLRTAGEASALFELHRRLKGREPRWERRFIDAVSTFVLHHSEQSGGKPVVAHADWLIDTLQAQSGPPNDTETDLVAIVCDRAGFVPDRLARFALQVVTGAIQRAGRADAWATERVRQVLGASLEDGRTWISRFEANQLLATNETIASANNDPAWNDLFARAIANHLLASAHPAPKTAGDTLLRALWFSGNKRSASVLVREIAPSIGQGEWFTRITRDTPHAAKARAAARSRAKQERQTFADTESRWFLKRLRWRETVQTAASPAEEALVAFLNKEAPGFTAALVAISDHCATGSIAPGSTGDGQDRTGPLTRGR
ncbi:MAG: hypothetical protein AAGJ32_00850 [Pseudomonadota bacterium]